MNSVKLISIVGARPQFVKLAPIARALAARESVDHRVLHTGQHYDQAMSASFFDELELPKPDYDLGVGSGTHAKQTGEMLTRLESVFTAEAPSAVLVYGDTNSTLAATLAATKLHVPVAHIEAGLRSFNRLMPEEINRLVADHCSDRLYAPTPQAMRNLDDENLASRSMLSGDVMLDAVRHNISLAESKSSALVDYKLEAGEFALVTIHRPVNTTGPALRRLLGALEQTSRHVPLVFPVHPRTRAVLSEIAYEPPDTLTLIDPLPYLDNILLIRAARVVITDSGGVQKEAAFLHTPCLTLRGETEWTETVEIGINRLITDAAGELADAVVALSANVDFFPHEVLQQLDVHYGKGDAANEIVDDCLAWIGA